VVYAVQIQCRQCQKLLPNKQRPLHFLAEVIAGLIYIKYCHRANNRGEYADGLYNSTINDKDGHIPSPLIKFTCTALRHDLLAWQKKNGVPPKASKSRLKAKRPDRLNDFNYKNDGGMNACCHAAMGRKLLTSPGVADTYTILMNTWNTLPESYQQRVLTNTHATVKRQIQQAENPMPAEVISTESVHVDNPIHLDYLTSEVALEEPEIGSTDPNIPIDNNCMDDELHFRMPGSSNDYDDEGDEIDESDAIPTASWQRRAAFELERFQLGTSDVDGYEGDDDAVVDAEEEASQADDGSTPNLQGSGHSTREYEDWRVNFRPVKYDNGKANAMASDVSEAKTVL